MERKEDPTEYPTGWTPEMMQYAKSHPYLQKPAKEVMAKFMVMVKVLKDGTDMMQDVTTEDLGMRAGEMDFVGFDIHALYNLIAMRAAIAGRSEAEMRLDVIDIICYCIKRGSNISEKALTRTSKAGAMRMRELMSRYSLKSRVGDDANALTPARFCTAFPLLTVMLRCEPNMSIKVVGTKPDALPAPLAFPGAAAVLDKSNDILKAKYREYSESFAQVVNRKAGDGAVKAAQATIPDFMNIAMENSKISAEQRQIIMSMALWKELQNCDISKWPFLFSTVGRYIDTSKYGGIDIEVETPPVEGFTFDKRAYSRFLVFCMVKTRRGLPSASDETVFYTIEDVPFKIKKSKKLTKSAMDDLDLSVVGASEDERDKIKAALRQRFA